MSGRGSRSAAIGNSRAASLVDGVHVLIGLAIVGLVAGNCRRVVGRRIVFDEADRYPCASQSERARQLLELAQRSAAKRDDDLLRRQLLARVEAAARYEHEDIVGTACRQATRRAVALLLRGVAASVSETLVIQRGARQIALRLFAIPMNIEFAEVVPESYVDVVLAAIDWADQFLPALASERVPEQGAIIPRFFRADDLLDVSASQLREIAESLAEGVPSFRVALPSHGSRKLASSFLRLCVGQMPVVVRSETAARECHGIQRLVREQLEGYFGTAVRVLATFDGSYHDAIFSGLWAYQSRRLRSIGRLLEMGFRATVAQLSTLPSGDSQRFRVCFGCGETALKPDYVLRERQFESLRSTEGRVRRALQTTAIKVCTTRDGHRPAGPCPSLPI